LFLIIPGKNAFKVQKWARVFTPKVLRVALSFWCTRKGQNNVLIDVLWLEIDEEFSLHNASVVDEHRGLTNL
jgi:hypothetical protein